MWPAAQKLELLFDIVNCKYGGSFDERKGKMQNTGEAPRLPEMPADILTNVLSHDIDAREGVAFVSKDFEKAAPEVPIRTGCKNRQELDPLLQSIRGSSKRPILSLQHCMLPKDVGKAMEALVAILPEGKIRTLDLSYNAIGSEEGVALAGALRKNKSLTHLDLYGNNIGPEGCSALAEALSENTSLKSLDLSKNRIDTKSLNMFKEVQQNRDFRFLHDAKRSRFRSIHWRPNDRWSQRRTTDLNATTRYHTLE